MAALKIAYERSLSVKQVLENQRSSLDFVAAETCRRLTGREPDRSVAFPIASDDSDFDSRMDRMFPSVRSQWPELTQLWRMAQPYKGGVWLSKLNDLANENKHRRLTPQARQLTQETQIQDGRGQGVALRGDVRVGTEGISLGPGGSITFGPGGRIELGAGGVFIQGARIDPRSQLPHGGARVSASRVTWVSFSFPSGDPVLETLHQIQSNCEALVEATARGLLQEPS